MKRKVFCQNIDQITKETASRDNQIAWLQEEIASLGVENKKLQVEVQHRKDYWNTEQQKKGIYLEQLRAKREMLQAKLRPSGSPK